MKAKELALAINRDPSITIEMAKKKIPIFTHSLPQNNWFFIFFKHLDPQYSAKFSILRPQIRKLIYIDSIILQKIESETPGIESIINAALTLYLKEHKK